MYGDFLDRWEVWIFSHLMARSCSTLWCPIRERRDIGSNISSIGTEVVSDVAFLLSTYRTLTFFKKVDDNLSFERDLDTYFTAGTINLVSVATEELLCLSWQPTCMLLMVNFALILRGSIISSVLFSTNMGFVIFSSRTSWQWKHCSLGMWRISGFFSEDRDELLNVIASYRRCPSLCDWISVSRLTLWTKIGK